jgi:hypothetical protein
MPRLDALDRARVVLSGAALVMLASAAWLGWVLL